MPSSTASPEPTDPAHLDLLVVGSGIAGLSAALRAARDHGLAVGLLTKGSLADAATRWAQGGVAAVLGGAGDSTDLHLADTLSVGAGLGDPAAVRVMVDEGPDLVAGLVSLGARFDRDEDGQLSLGREGGHSASRVVHAGGAATGAEIERVLVEAVRATAARVVEHAFALDLLVGPDGCAGVLVRHPDGTISEVRADNVLVAAGGAGQVFAVTTNPAEATGDGVAMALRAGVACADLEFVQFHPTALHIDRSPRPLVTEALRGEGALLRDLAGERFVDELSPRDVVSRAMTRRMLDTGAAHLWLDVTGVDDLAGRFPSITAALAGVGLDASVDWLPVSPAAHYLCGGIVTDLDGATSLDGLWAAGEVACSGVHGANRLASNSLLEGLVFGHRAAAAVASGRRGARATGAMAALGELGGLVVPAGGPAPSGNGAAPAGEVLADASAPGPASPLHCPPSLPPGAAAGRSIAMGLDPAVREELGAVMFAGAGLERSAASLAAVAEDLERLAGRPGDGSVAALEAANLLTVARAQVCAAAARTESRGTHNRTDYPETDPQQRRRLVCGGGAGAG